MKKAVTFCLIVVGLINFAPVLGIVSALKLETAYSIVIAGNDLEILMRHRALLFGILGAFILYAAFNPLFQKAAMLVAGVSMIGFVLLTLSIGTYNDAIGKVLFVDIVGIVFLLAAMVSKYLDSNKNSNK